MTVFRRYFRGCDYPRHKPETGEACILLVEEKYASNYYTRQPAIIKRYFNQRWRPSTGRNEPTGTPIVYGREVNPGDFFPLTSSLRKRMKEGVPEGYIHYLDGHFEPFWAESTPVPEGTFGYAVIFNSYSVKGPEECTVDYIAFGEQMPLITGKPLDLHFFDYNHSGAAWFANKQDAKEFVRSYRRRLKEFKQTITSGTLETGAMACEQAMRLRLGTK